MKRTTAKLPSSTRFASRDGVRRLGTRTKRGARVLVPFTLALAALGNACGPTTSREQPPAHEHDQASASEGVETHLVRGQYLFHSAQNSTTTVTLNHEEIPGFMDAMAMPYVIQDVELMKGLSPGQDVRFRVVVETGGFYFVDRIEAFTAESSPAK